MIIFDTNAVNLLHPEGPTADIIRKLRQSGHHRVAVPWMVLEELAAHQARFYPVRYQAIVNSLDKLREILPWELKSSLESLDLERFLDYWRQAYGEIFEVIETSDAAIRRAYQREAMALPPAKRNKDRSEGGRDAAIWFSILDFLEQNPDQHAYFVTDNTSDFGDGTTYPYPMNEDIRGLENRLTRLKDFAQVVSQFTQEVSGKDAEAAAAKLLASPSVRNGVAEAASGLSTLTGYTGLGDADAPEQWYAWFGTPEVELVAVTDVKGHAIEGDVWYTATAQWLLYGLAVDEREALSGNIACVWETKILFSAGDGMGPTLLTSGEPASPDADDELCMKILQGLKKRVTDIAAAAKRNVLAARTPAEQLVSDRVASALSGLDLSSVRLARQAALLYGPTQRIAQQAAEQLRLVNGPAQQIARQLEANRAALNAAINAPGLHIAQQVAQQLAAMPRLDVAVPRIDIPGYTYQPHSGEAVRRDDAATQEQSGPAAPVAREAESADDETGTDDSSPGE
ncbi:PIN domain-containing protein [Streptomyces cylindrosporus]|uniref:PIN domain-containing protein n=1 Tax=Streptomyces cylindrosporus TaxID=2927583 RepID=A0ABS9YIH3_9ACTN|nr:PIN domain-containing protein [Streptomyces cylindrosporus]MCI3277023.1 PIN domain-containing protein [Streptomyces cylindrosporus]